MSANVEEQERTNQASAESVESTQDAKSVMGAENAGTPETAERMKRSEETDAATDNPLHTEDSPKEVLDDVVSSAVDQIQEIKEEASKSEKIPVIFKVFGVLNIVMGVLSVPVLAILLISLVSAYVQKVSSTGQATSISTAALVVVMLLSALVLCVMYFVLGVRLLRNKRRGVSALAYVMIGVAVIEMILELMLAGFGALSISAIVGIIYLIILSVFIDPSLSEERELQRKLRDMETRTEAEEGTLGRDKTGKGYLKLDFFNLFWITIIGCVVGIVFETFYVGFTTGVWHNRTGMLWGPFSPIFGIGGALMTIALNRMYNKPLWLTFLVAAFIGAAFEYFVSVFLQAAFGIVAWDYSNHFLNIDGRTDLFHFLAWGFLGMIFVRWLMPLLLKIVNLIPWKWRYGVTAVFAAFMLVNATLTLISFDRWYERLKGIEPASAVETWVDETFPNDWMKGHFNSMSINPENANRMDSTAGKLDGPAGTT